MKWTVLYNGRNSGFYFTSFACRIIFLIPSRQLVQITGVRLFFLSDWPFFTHDFVLNKLKKEIKAKKPV